MKPLVDLASMSIAQVREYLSAVGHDDIPGALDVLEADGRAGVRKLAGCMRKVWVREEAERERVRGMYALMTQLACGRGPIVGVDEVGRGSVAGPLCVGAVILDDEPIWGINDSKQLSPARREELDAIIRSRAVAYGLGYVEPSEIDSHGMAASLREGIRRAIAGLGCEPGVVIIDGVPLHLFPNEVTLPKGDARVASIAAASIVAKVDRDRLMCSYDLEFPGYHLAESKGYASAAHIEAIRCKGLSPIHRASFCQGFLQETLF